MYDADCDRAGLTMKYSRKFPPSLDFTAWNGVERRLIVPAELAGRRLDQAAAALFPEFSRSRLKTWIDAGELTLSGAGALRARTLLHGGEELALATELDPEVAVEPEAIPLTLVYSDESLLVIDKPVGLGRASGRGQPLGHVTECAAALRPGARDAAARRSRASARQGHERPAARRAQPCESQDARGRARAARRAAHVFRDLPRRVDGGGVIEAPIGRHPRERTKMAVVERGRPARTRYRVIERFRAHTHCEVELDTGRTHQIRVHMAHIRAPLVGDPVYGGRPRLPRAPSERLRWLLQGFRRQALHATRLEFTHPGNRRAS